MNYTLSRVGTGQGVGWFACVPEPQPSLDDAIRYTREHPNDLFMRRHLLDLLRDVDPSEMTALIEGAGKDDRHLLALAYETCVLNTRFESLKGLFQGVSLQELTEFSPMIVIPSTLRDHNEQHFYWLRQFSANANLLRPLPFPDQANFPLPFGRKEIDAWQARTVSLKDMAPPPGKGEPGPQDTPVKEVAKHLRNRLEQLGILTGWDTRTEATLSPFAVERPWNLLVTVADGRNQWRLSGTQTGYGRGLNIGHARISCLMEIVERCSAFASFQSGRVLGYEKDSPLVRGAYAELLARGFHVLNPNDLCLEVPYRGQSLWWIEGEQVSDGGRRSIRVPAQMVFLFSNLDEISLTSGLSSNGLAAGNTVEGARLSALLEVIERDAEKVVPYTREKGFLVRSDDMKVSSILDECGQKGIQIQFVDITPETGIPCYKAFVQGPGGVILKGTGAHLDGKRALLSAMTEIPYPYPYWFGSMPAPEGLKLVEYEDLPNYASGDPEKDLDLLERVLMLNGYSPIYVDLTRKDLGIPVVKALVPGLEIMTVLDRFSPLGVRQFGHYLARQ
jgi:ribosomal protein S12 methylthiotransferase accessory factor